jgi:ribosomal protein S18 acetylase RimI-like enzyme
MVDRLNLRMKRCLYGHWDFVLFLRNMFKGGFIDQADISHEDHLEFMIENANRYMICTHEDIPVGFVGQVDGDIRVATHPEYQGMGVGKFMINEFMEKNPKCSATVKVENEASLALFESCGFKRKYIVLEK